MFGCRDEIEFMKLTPVRLVSVLGMLWVFVLAIPCEGFALGSERYVETAPSAGSFPIVAGNSVASIQVDADDFVGVVRAAGDLQADIARVSGRLPAVSHDEKNIRGNVILVGTIGKSRAIDALIRDRKIDVAPITGQWESFLIQVVRKPLPGIDRALVICGSDQRGTIYGIYDLSEQIGVSPWHFFADVPPRHHEQLFVKAGKFVKGPPAVKYRGIFINDESPDLTGWVKAHYGNYNHGFYTNVFELLLRLKANYLWPAMWDNCFNEDDPLNPKLADEYGIVMGTSHVEPMMRADKEWDRAGFTAREWNFQTHSNELLKFWRAGLERNKNYESLLTIAMRGKIDTAMSPTANVALLEEIVAAQRQLIADVYHTNAAAVPQLWALYKEVQEYYEKGLRVPDDVTLLWCDDNWGNLRRVPPPEDRQRAGGAGIYYHLDYVGGPRNYKWVNSVSLPRLWEQMNLAHEYGANRIWIVNVGHLCHVQLPMEFFLSLARNPERWREDNISEFTRLWAQREFGPEFAPQIADITAQFMKFNSRRKPELLSPETFSVENYGEADQVLAGWKKIADAAENISAHLPADRRDAFFELVLYPVKACANLNELYIAAAKNHRDAAQGRASANDYAAEVKRLFQADAELSAYYNHTLAGGKWNHMMDQTHIGYTRWQQPDANAMPPVVEVKNGGAGILPTSFDQRRADLKLDSRGQDARATRSAKGFIEADGCVSIEAEHFSKNVAGKPARWEKIDGLGNTLSAMTIFPVTAASVMPPENSPCLEYQMFLFHAGTIKVETRIAPTLNFVAGRGLRFALSFDDAPPQIITAVPENYSVGSGDFNRDWGMTVSDNIRKVITEVDLPTAGEHTLKIWMVDPGVVVEKIIVDCGGVKPSYLGPPESFHR
jgi:hypothetical protein